MFSALVKLPSSSCRIIRTKNQGHQLLVSVNICSVEVNSAGIFFSKVSPGIFVIKVK